MTIKTAISILRTRDIFKDVKLNFEASSAKLCAMHDVTQVGEKGYF